LYAPNKPRHLETPDLKLPGPLGGKKKTRKKSARGVKSSRKKKRGTGSQITPLTWVLLVVILVLMGGVGLVKWAETGTGKATLLTLGSEQAFQDVQDEIEAVLAQNFPNFPVGPHAPEKNPEKFSRAYDWPAPELGPQAHVRCRVVAINSHTPYEQIQFDLEQSLRKAGGRILWSQRIFPDKPGKKQESPNNNLDQLRLDVGVKGKPTHTLVLHRSESRPLVSWGGRATRSAWEKWSSGMDGPVVALVIDDWGHARTAATRELLKLPIPLTMAVLPKLPYSRHFALKSTDLVLPRVSTAGEVPAGNPAISVGRSTRLAAGCFVEFRLGDKSDKPTEIRREVMLHLPMEPQDYPATNPGADPLLVGMGEGEIVRVLDTALQNLPGVVGINNHMGSAATSDPATMQALMGVLRQKGLYFVDSLTTARSVAYDQALIDGVPALRNRIFLDYDNENEATITANLNTLVRTARGRGFALGIGHVHAATARVLAREIPRLQAEGVRFVTVSEMMALMRETKKDGTP
jgi:polysaccharide deacetylase 2 family uncharacterized protein YibQ